jgi:tetratricopeptide (TPR) repeat protein
VNLGEVDLARGRPEAAEGDFRAALRIDPDLVVARLDLARSLLHRGRRDASRRRELWASARQEYLHLLEAKPDVAEAHHDLAFMDYEAGALERALALVEETGARCYAPFVRVERARLARLSGDEAGYEHEMRLAQRLFTEMGATARAAEAARGIGR